MLLYANDRYLLYDFVIEGVFTTPIRWPILAHHIFGLVTHWSARYYFHPTWTLLCMMVYLAESSTPFLHMCWLGHQLGIQDGILFPVLASIGMISFFLFRILWGPYILYTFIQLEDIFSNPTILGSCLGISILGFCILNVIWFRVLINIFIKAVVNGQKKDKHS